MPQRGQLVVVSIAEKIKNEVYFYGVDVPIYKSPVKEVSDAPHCIRCKHEYEYSYHTFGHLGGFSCPECGYRRPDPDLSVTEIISSFVDSTIIKVNYSGETELVRINLPAATTYTTRRAHCLSLRSWD